MFLLKVLPSDIVQISLSILQWTEIVGWPKIESSSSAPAPWFTQTAGVAWKLVESLVKMRGGGESV